MFTADSSWERMPQKVGDHLRPLSLEYLHRMAEVLDGNGLVSAIFNQEGRCDVLSQS